MSIINTLETEGHKALTAIEHAAAWLVGAIAQAEQSLTSLEASSPLVATAIANGEAAATAHGLPIVAVENIGEAVIAAAKELAAGLTSPPAPATGSGTATAAVQDANQAQAQAATTQAQADKPAS